MSNELTIFKTGAVAKPASAFQAIQGYDHKMSAGIGVGFAKITYKGGRWAIKHQGNTNYLRRYVQAQNGQLMDDGPNPFLDVVIVDVAEHPSKFFYEGNYQEGDMAPPDCWSSNGVTPDSGAPKKQATTCVGCPKNAWGSRVRNDGIASRGKACTDHKRFAVVPVADIENKTYGGPMLLQVPPTSLKELVMYEQKLAQAGFRFFEVWTRVSFNPQFAFPVFQFDAIMPLNDQQASAILKTMDDPLIDRMLNTELVEVTDVAEQAQPGAVTAAGNQQAAPPPVAQPIAQPVTASVAQPAAQPMAQPVTQPTTQPTTPPVDTLEIPAHLRAASAPVEPVRPSGLSDQEWEMISASRKALAQPPTSPPDPSPPAPKRTRTRTAPVTPQPTTPPETHVAQTVAQPMPTVQPGAPTPAAQPMTPPPANGLDASAVEAIGAKIKSLL